MFRNILTIVIVAIVAGSAVADRGPRGGGHNNAPQRGGFQQRGGNFGHGGYARPMEHHYNYGRSSGWWFGGCRTYYPVYAAPVYCAPVVVQQVPIMAQPSEPMCPPPPPPAYSGPPAPTTQPVVIQLQFPQGFVETGRRYHSHGDDAGTIDWVRGTIDGKKVKVTFNADGTRREIEND